MFNRLINSINEMFFISPWIMIPCIIVGSTVLAFMIIVTIIFVLDSSDRNISQKPYSIIFDHFLPIIAIFMPMLIVSALNSEKTYWLEKFSWIILLHCSIIVPSIFFWAKHRCWLTNNDLKKTSFSWKHPILFHYISLVLIYVYIYLFYFSFIRFLRIGNETNIILLLQNVLSLKNVFLVILLITALPNLFAWCVIIFTVLSTIKNYLYSKASLLVYSLHLELLHFYKYALIMEKCYKLGFILFNLVCLNAPLNRDKHYESHSLFRRVINTLYYKPYLLTIILFLTVIIEILCTRTIALSYYSLFWFPIFMGLFKLIHSLYKTSLIKDVCMTDYSNKDLTQIKYPSIFWKYIEDPDLFYGFSVILPNNLYIVWEKNNVYSHKVIEQLFKKMQRLQQDHPYSLFIFIYRIKTAYYLVSKVRWNNKSLQKE